jgi:hypothetical protein
MPAMGNAAVSVYSTTVRHASRAFTGEADFRAHRTYAVPVAWMRHRNLG